MDKKELKNLVAKMDKTELTDDARKQIKGSFIRLNTGTTHYEMKGNGEPIILVHGYATPYYIYDKLFNNFVEDGYKVIRYDLIGRGYSDRPLIDYTPEAFVNQLNELANALIGDESFYLIGTSMGGIICSSYCAKYPEKVKKLVLLAPAGMDSYKVPIYMKICKSKIFGKFIFNNFAGKLLLKHCASEIYYLGIEEKDSYMRQFGDAAKYKGFLRCTLSSLRNTILNFKESMKGYESLGKTEIPILCIWGTHDKTMPYYQHTRLLDVCKQTKLISYENSGHIFLYDEGSRTYNDAIKFIKD